MAMRRLETSEIGGASGLSGLVALGLLAAGVYAAHAWLADSPYWMAHGHRPLAIALRAAALAIDWSQGLKVVLILGSSLFAMRTHERPASRASRAPSQPKAAPPPMTFSLEAVR
jgi:hypothetical protein